MRYEGKSRLRGGSFRLERLTFTPQPDGKVRQFWQQSSFDGPYSRQKPLLFRPIQLESDPGV